MEHDDDHDVEMVVVEYSSSDEDSDSDSNVDSEYGEPGEHVVRPRVVTEKSPVAKHEFYQAAVRRQNCFFGLSMVTVAGLFLAAYFFMGLSFTPSNIGIFGDESALKGGAGEVGLDADNSQTEEIVDEEVVAMEESGSKAAKRAKREKEFPHIHDKVGQGKEWVENKNWWKKHAEEMDTSHMSKHEKKQYEQKMKQFKRMKKRRDKICKEHPDAIICNKDGDTDLGSIREKLGKNYNYEATGRGKENFPKGWPKEEGESKRDKQKKDKHKHNHDSDGEEKHKPVHKPDEHDNGAEEIKEEIQKQIRDKPVAEAPEEKAKEPEVKLPHTIVNTFTVLEKVDHDPSSFTQGLSIGSDGTIYETTGLYRQSKVRRINPKTFGVETSVDTEGQYFGEGSTYYEDKDGNGRLIEITWKEQTGFIYDAKTLELLDEFPYTTTPNKGNQGWGITYDPSKKEFVVSDGTQFLYFWDRGTLAEKRKVAIKRFDGRAQQSLNELEFMDGLVCCNIWHSDDIICVDPQTGKSVREYDMSSLWPANQRGGGENVLNGIALAKDHVLITGKRWDRMYKVHLPDWPTLFRN
ncbi:hypothetical protein ACHAXT_006170 [Thalassiosira profunda]